MPKARVGGSVERILWDLQSGAQWSELPYRYCLIRPAIVDYSSGASPTFMSRLLEGLAKDLEQRGKINLEEWFIGVSFSVAKKGPLGKANLSGARAARSWQLQTALVFLFPQAQQVLRNTSLKVSRNLIGYNAYASDASDNECTALGFGSRHDRQIQGGRALRRYKRRWKIERLFA